MAGATRRAALGVAAALSRSRWLRQASLVRSHRCRARTARTRRLSRPFVPLHQQPPKSLTRRLSHAVFASNRSLRNAASSAFWKVATTSSVTPAFDNGAALTQPAQMLHARALSAAHLRTLSYLRRCMSTGREKRSLSRRTSRAFAQSHASTLRMAKAPALLAPRVSLPIPIARVSQSPSVSHVPPSAKGGVRSSQITCFPTISSPSLRRRLREKLS